MSDKSQWELGATGAPKLVGQNPRPPCGRVVLPVSNLQHTNWQNHSDRGGRRVLPYCERAKQQSGPAVIHHRAVSATSQKGCRFNSPSDQQPFFLSFLGFLVSFFGLSFPLAITTSSKLRPKIIAPRGHHATFKFGATGPFYGNATRSDRRPTSHTGHTRRWGRSH